MSNKVIDRKQSASAEVDKALFSSRPVEEVKAEKRRNVSKKLRWVGSISVVLAAIVFMVQGMDAYSSYERVVNAGVLTATLAVLGFFSYFAAREVKGTRTFFGLAAASLPVIFSQLGAMAFSLVGNVPEGMPRLLILKAGDPILLSMVVLGVCVLSVPVVYLTSSAFVRKHAKVLTTTILAANLMLLFPVRSPAIIAVLAATFIALAVFKLKDGFFKDASARTMEGRILTSIVLAPILCLLGRSFFYPGSYLVVSSMFAGLGLMLYLPQTQFSNRKHMQGLSRVTGALFFVLAWIVFALNTFSLDVSSAELMFAIHIPAMAIMLWASKSLDFGKRSLEGIVFFHAIIAATASLVMTPVWGASLGCATIATLLAAFALQRETKLLWLGVGASLSACLVLILGSNISLIIESPWIALSAAGVLAILSATIIESGMGAKMRKWLVLKSSSSS